MSGLPFIAAAATALLIVSVGSSVRADDCTLVPGNGSATASQYQGYSKKPAKKFDARGNSTVKTSNIPWSLRCIITDDNGDLSIQSIPQYTITEQEYTDGPGNSPFEKKNPFAPPSCVLADTASIPCPF